MLNSRNIDPKRGRVSENGLQKLLKIKLVDSYNVLQIMYDFLLLFCYMRLTLPAFPRHIACRYSTKIQKNHTL